MKRLGKWIRGIKRVPVKVLSELEARDAVRMPRSLTMVSGIYPCGSRQSDHSDRGGGYGRRT